MAIYRCPCSITSFMWRKNSVIINEAGIIRVAEDIKWDRSGKRHIADQHVSIPEVAEIWQVPVKKIFLESAKTDLEYSFSFIQASLFLLDIEDRSDNANFLGCVKSGVEIRRGGVIAAIISHIHSSPQISEIRELRVSCLQCLI